MGESLSKWQHEQPPLGVQQNVALDLSTSSSSNESQLDKSYVKTTVAGFTTSVSFNSPVAHQNSVPRAHGHNSTLIHSQRHRLDLSPAAVPGPTQFSLNLASHNRNSRDKSAISSIRELSSGENLATASPSSNDADSDSHHQSSTISKSPIKQQPRGTSSSPLRVESNTPAECDSIRCSSVQPPQNTDSSSQHSSSQPQTATVIDGGNHQATNNVSYSTPLSTSSHVSELSSSIDSSNKQPPAWLTFPYVASHNMSEGYRQLVNTQRHEQTTFTHSSSPIQLLADFSRQRVPPLDSIEHVKEEKDDTSITYSDREYTSESSRKRRTNKRKKGKLWEFILDLLLSKDMNPSVVKWEDERRMVFKITNPKFVAELWGQRKCNPNMTFEKLSRAMRHYYKLNILLKVDGGPHLYQFGDLTEA